MVAEAVATLAAALARLGVGAFVATMRVVSLLSFVADGLESSSSVCEGLIETLTEVWAALVVLGFASAVVAGRDATAGGTRVLLGGSGLWVMKMTGSV
jgi:hypothetical protein